MLLCLLFLAVVAFMLVDCSPMGVMENIGITVFFTQSAVYHEITCNSCAQLTETRYR